MTDLDTLFRALRANVSSAVVDDVQRACHDQIQAVLTNLSDTTHDMFPPHDGIDEESWDEALAHVRNEIKRA